MKKILTLGLMAITLLGAVFLSVPVFAEDDQKPVTTCGSYTGGERAACEACITSGQSYAGNFKCSGTDNTDINAIIRTVGNIIAGAAGGVCVIFIIIAGIKYATSGGDEKKITSAKHTLTYAIIGLAIAVFAAIIVNFVISMIQNNIGG